MATPPEGLPDKKHADPSTTSADVPDLEEAESILKVAGEFTNQALSASQQLCLAGLAVIWLFRVTAGSNLALPAGLLWPTLLFTFGLGVNFCYWAGGALLWRLDYRFFRGGADLTPLQFRVRNAVLKVEKCGPAEIRTFGPTSFMFWTTLAATAAGWSTLLYYLGQRVFFALP